MANNLANNKPASEQTGTASAVSALRGSFMTRSGTGEVTGQYQRIFADLVRKEGNPEMQKIQVISIDGAAAGVAISTVAITYKAGDAVFAYLLLLEQTIPGLPNRTIRQPMGGEISIPHVVGDLYKESLWVRLAGVIASTLGVDAKKCVDCGASIIYKEMPPVAHDADTSQFRPLLWTAINAIISSINIVDPNRQDFDASELKSHRVSAKVSFMNGGINDEAGMPVRAGFEIKTFAQTQGQEDIVLSGSQPLSHVTGYVDIIQLSEEAARDAYMARTGVNAQAMAMIPTMGQMQIARFAPRIVCTYVQTSMDELSLNTLLLSLSTNALLLQNRLWRHHFANKYAGGDDLHSLAGLGHELGMVVDPRDSNFSLSQFLDANLLPTPAFTVHIPDVGPTSHLLSILRTACSNDNGSAQARTLIMSSLNQATGGAFARYFDVQNAPMGFVEDNVVPLGYFHDTNGVRRDLREIDHLAIANLSNDAAVICDYVDTNNFELNIPGEKRLADKIHIYDQQLQGKYVIKGWARPVTLSPDFVVAIYNAFHEAAGGIRLDNTHEALEEAQRGMSTMVNYLINPMNMRQTASTFSNNSNWNMGYRNMFTHGQR